MKTKLFIALSILLGATYTAVAQGTPAQPTGYAKIIDGDTIYIHQLDNVVVYGQSLTPEQQKYWWNLRRNVRKVYPYAILASRIIEETERTCAGMSKRERKKYLRKRERELRAQYKTELKNLTTTQGKILIKLINRHTGRDAYSLIKELRGGLTARVSQTGAYLFDNNLKSVYNPYGEDRDIEVIVKELEAEGRFK